MERAFEVHLLNDTGQRKAGTIALLFDSLLTELRALCPESRELSLAVTKLEEACFFAKKAMAKEPENQQ